MVTFRNKPKFNHFLKTKNKKKNFNLQNHPTFHSDDRLVNFVREREFFVGLSILFYLWSPQEKTQFCNGWSRRHGFMPNRLTPWQSTPFFNGARLECGDSAYCWTECMYDKLSKEHLRNWLLYSWHLWFSRPRLTSYVAGCHPCLNHPKNTISENPIL